MVFPFGNKISTDSHHIIEIPSGKTSYFDTDYRKMLLSCESEQQITHALLFMIANELMDLNQTLIHIEEK